MFPATSLAPTHRYGLVVTRRLRSLEGTRFEPWEFLDPVPPEANGHPARRDATRLADDRSTTRHDSRTTPRIGATGTAGRVANAASPL